MRQLAQHLELCRMLHEEQTEQARSRFTRVAAVRTVVGLTLVALGIGGSALLEMLVLERMGVR